MSRSITYNLTTENRLPGEEKHTFLYPIVPILPHQTVVFPASALLFHGFREKRLSAKRSLRFHSDSYLAKTESRMTNSIRKPLPSPATDRQTG